MLDKIKDIQLNLNSSKTDYYSGQYKKNSNAKKDFQYNDSLDCSEAIQYIIEKKWQIKELSFLSANRLSISFSVEGVEFHTTLDIVEINSTSRLDYSISFEKDADSGKKKLTADITITCTAAELAENNESELPGIKMLMKRLFSLNIENELNSNDSSVLDNIYDDIVDFINFDMAYINSCLFEFVQKLTGSKINITNKNLYSSISLKKITVTKL